MSSTRVCREVLQIAATVLVGLLLIPASVRADGLLQQLPEDGSWARFDVETQIYKRTGEPGTKFTGSFTISSVGKATVDGEPCRYIELKSFSKSSKPDGGEAQEGTVNIHKFLIPEKRLAAGESSLEHVRRGFFRVGGGKSNDGQPIPFRQFDIDEVRVSYRDMLRTVLPGSLKDVRKLPAETVECKLGKYTFVKGWLPPQRDAFSSLPWCLSIKLILKRGGIRMSLSVS